MARPKGRTKTERVTINLDEGAYTDLVTVARRTDTPVAQVARRAVVEFLRREEESIGQSELPLRHRLEE